LGTVVGQADSLSEASDMFWHSAAVVLPVLGAATNCWFNDPVLLRIYDVSDAREEHEFRDLLRPPLAGLPPSTREVKAETALGLVVAMAELTPRLHRVALNYSEALVHWHDGGHLRAVEMIFRAAEALSEPVVDRELEAAALTKKKLAEAWGVAKKHLQRSARDRIIFGDQKLSQEIEEISNGLEHGYEDIPSLQKRSSPIRDEAATAVRRAFLPFLKLDPSALKELFDPPFDKPKRTDPLIDVVEGRLQAPAEMILPPREEPRFEGSAEIKDVELLPDGLNLTRKWGYTFKAEPGVKLNDMRSGVFGPVTNVHREP
jgi:hypothetical protein